jgi:hypothetical protein
VLLLQGPLRSLGDARAYIDTLRYLLTRFV